MFGATWSDDPLRAMGAADAPTASLWLWLAGHAAARLGLSAGAVRLGATALGLLLGMLAVAMVGAGRRRARPVPYVVRPPQLPRADTAPAAEKTEVRQAGSSAVHCYAPATGCFLGLVNAASPAAIDRAVAAAAAAQTQWAQTTLAQRAAVLRSLLQHVLDNAHDICRVAAADSGKTLVDAHLGEILVTVERIRWTLAHGERALRPERRPTNLLMAYKHNSVCYEPLGVVAALVSWNYPFHNLIAPVVSALFAGNTIVVKVSEQTAWSSGYFAAIARGALVAHGHDPALVQPVVCWPQTAAHLTAHPAIAHITFIGSQAVARRVAASAAQALTPLVAELGGKDPCLVLDSATADVPRIVDIVLRGTFQAAGQNCIGIERLIAPGRVYDDLVARLEPRVRALRLGPDADVGALISAASFDRLEALVADAVAQGARLLVGGRRHHHPRFPRGHYFEPTLLVDVTPAMAIAHHECFAPILTCMRAAASTPAALLAVANAPAFGLGASVFASERDPALPAVVRGLRAGMVAVNDFAAFYAVQLPFGGVGASGYGRFAGAEGLRGLCNPKSVCADRFPRLRLRTVIPPPLRYPVADPASAWRFLQAVVELAYATPRRKLGALGALARNL